MVRAFGEYDDSVAYAAIFEPLSEDPLVVTSPVDVCGIEGVASLFHNGIEKRDALFQAFGAYRDRPLDEARDRDLHARYCTVFHASSPAP